MDLRQKFSNSFDIFVRGEEILSGGQRIHHAPMLEERMKTCGIDPETMIDYVNGFRWGCPPVRIVDLSISFTQSLAPSDDHARRASSSLSRLRSLRTKFADEIFVICFFT